MHEPEKPPLLVDHDRYKIDSKGDLLVSIAKKPDGPEHLYHALNERLPGSNKADVIELYYELLSSGHSVGEILSAVGLNHGKSDRGNPAISERPKPGVADAASEPTPGAALVRAAEANEPDAVGLSMLPDAARWGSEEPRTGESACPNDFMSDEGKRLPPCGLPGVEPDLAASAGPDSAAGSEKTPHSAGEEELPRGALPDIAKRLAFGALYIALIAAVAVVGLPIVRGDLYLTTSGAAGSVALPSLSAIGSALSEALKPKQRVADAESADRPQAPPPVAPNAAFPIPPRTTAASPPEQASEDGRMARATPEPEGGRPNAIEQSADATSAQPEPERGGTPWAVLSRPIAPAGAAEIANSANSTTTTATALADVAKTSSADVEVVKFEPRLSEFAATVSTEAPVAVVSAPAPPHPEVAPDDQRFKRAEPDAILARGDAFFATGDLASARLFYEQAASAGNGAAALRLGATFDPDFLTRAHAGLGQGDLTIASYWYRRARDLGNADAEILLRRMENILK
jgi:hypothetical protein